MSVSPNFLVKILQLELIEVENDLNGLKELYTNRHDSSEITNYVFLENTALLQLELQSIHQISSILADFKFDKNGSSHKLLDEIDNFIKEEIKSRQFSEAIYNFIKLKLIKVSKYLDM